MPVEQLNAEQLNIVSASSPSNIHANYYWDNANNKSADMDVTPSLVLSIAPIKGNDTITNLVAGYGMNDDADDGDPPKQFRVTEKIADVKKAIEAAGIPLLKIEDTYITPYGAYCAVTREYGLSQIGTGVLFNRRGLTDSRKLHQLQGFAERYEGAIINGAFRAAAQEVTAFLKDPHLAIGNENAKAILSKMAARIDEFLAIPRSHYKVKTSAAVEVKRYGDGRVSGLIYFLEHHMEQLKQKSPALPDGELAHLNTLFLNMKKTAAGCLLKPQR